MREHARFALRGVRNAIDRPGRATKAKPAVDKEAPAKRSTRLSGNADAAGPTSELLLDAAAALFCEKGFNETTTREIATRLNIHQASLYYHMSGKEELLYRISRVSLEALERRVAAAIRTSGKGRDRLNAFIRGHLEGMFENPDRAFAFISEFRSLSRAHRREMSMLRRNYSDLLKQEIASAVNAGFLRRDISVSVLRLALFNYLNWTPRWYHVSGRLPLAGLAGIYSRVFFEGVVTPGHGRPALPQLQSQRRRRPGAGHNGTLGKFVRTAAELFSKQGYASTSTRALSALIGMEKATLYYHVRSKEDLLYLIAKSSVETLQEDVQKAVEGITCPLDHLAVLMRAHCISLLRDQTQHATVAGRGARPVTGASRGNCRECGRTIRPESAGLSRQGRRTDRFAPMWSRAILLPCFRGCSIARWSGTRRVVRLGPPSWRILCAKFSCSEPGRLRRCAAALNEIIRGLA